MKSGGDSQRCAGLKCISQKAASERGQLLKALRWAGGGRGQLEPGEKCSRYVRAGASCVVGFCFFFFLFFSLAAELGLDD